MSGPTEQPSDLAGDGLPDGLRAALVSLPRPLLVALDFDGVCAPLVDDPEDSRMLPEVRDAVVALAAHADVRVALVSGRGLESLRRVADPPAGVDLVGGHGAEVDGGAGPDQAQTTLLEQVVAEVEQIAGRHERTAVEHKPTSVVLHSRLAADDVARAATAEVLQGPGSREGVQVRRGHDVLELAVVQADKGSAVTALRERASAAAVLYAGDDVTDEDVFEVLDEHAGDVGVKVGAGTTAARYRVGSPADVGVLLGVLVDALRDTSG